MGAVLALLHIKTQSLYSGIPVEVSQLIFCRKFLYFGPVWELRAPPMLGSSARPFLCASRMGRSIGSLLCDQRARAAGNWLSTRSFTPRSESDDWPGWPHTPRRQKYLLPQGKDNPQIFHSSRFVAIGISKKGTGYEKASGPDLPLHAFDRKWCVSSCRHVRHFLPLRASRVAG